jgi:uncharacterized protein
LACGGSDDRQLPADDRAQEADARLRRLIRWRAVAYYAVVRERGSAWDGSRPMREQDGWDGHAAFMDALVDERVIVRGGPLGEGELRFLLIFDAPSEEAIRARLDEDPWTQAAMLRIASIESWEVLLGDD